MKLSRKFDIHTLIITGIFIVVFFASYNTIKLLSRETSNLFDISIELDYLKNLKNSLTNLDHSIELYLHILPDQGSGEAVERDLSEFRRVLKYSEKIKLDDEEKQIIKFSMDNFREFSIMIDSLLQDEGRIKQQDIKIYQRWKKKYIEKISFEIDKHWKEDLEKVNKLLVNAEAAKQKALWILLVTAATIFLMVIVSRIFVSRTIAKPIKIIKDASDAIAKGDTGKRIDIKSRDELGSLSGSINIMAEAIEDKINRLKDSIVKEQAVVREQTILNELMGFIASGIDIEVVLRTFIGKTRDLLKAEHSSIFILESQDAGKDPDLKIFINTFEEKTSMDCAKAMLNGVFKDVFKTFMPIRTNTLMGKVPAMPFELKNMLAVPLSSIDKKVLGLIVLVNKDGGFTKDDEGMLFNFSFQAFHAIAMQQEILRYATTDGLTGLNNYRVFIQRLKEEVERSKRYSRDISLLMVDIDHFKSFNDIYGHQTGNNALRDIAKLIFEHLRTTDFAARYGGEEFAVILPETAGSQALIVAERLRKSISRHEFIPENGEPAHVTVSIGYASFPDDADTGELLIKRADQGLYLAKESGKNRVCRYSDLYRKVKDNVPEEIKHILQDMSLTSIKELAKAIDAKSNYMRGHSFEVAALAVMTGKELRLSENQIEGLKIASLLHDLGNLGIPDNILNKPSLLTDEEKKIIRSHPGLPEMVLKHYPNSEYVLSAILYHHERFDGRGYPRGLKEEEIPLQAKILGVVEAYNAMISARPYKRRKTRLEAIAEMEKEAGKQFDPKVVKIFINLLKKIEDPIEDPVEKRKNRDN